MRRVWLGLLLAGAVECLVSLYLPWEEAQDGWGTVVGDVVALAALAAAALVLLELRTRRELPVVPAGILLVVAQLGAARELHANVRYRLDASPDLAPKPHPHYAYGALVALMGLIVVAGAVVGLVAARMVRPTRAQLVHAALAVATLVVLLLPWAAYEGYAALGIAFPSGTVAAVTAVTLAAAQRPLRPLLAATTAVLLGGAASVPALASHPYGWKLGIAIAGVLFAFAIVDTDWRGGRVPVRAVVIGVACIALLTALFFTAEWVCDPQCTTNGNGWTFVLPVVAGVLAIALAAVAFAPTRVPVSSAELAAAIAVLVATYGLAQRPFPGAKWGGGAFATFAAATVLVALGLSGVRPANVRVRFLPVLVCALYVAVLVVPAWRALPFDVEAQLRPILPTWFLVAALLLTMHVASLWLASLASAWLVLGPLAALSLSVTSLIRVRDVSWGSGSLMGLALVLAYLGHVERRHGLENFRVPAILRVDRL